MQSVTGREQPLRMTGQEVVSKLVGHGESDKAFVLDVKGVANAEGISDAHQESRYTRLSRLLGLDVDIMPSGDLERANRERRETAILDNLLCRVFSFEAGKLLGHGSRPILAA